jgi:hypothetical protein
MEESRKVWDGRYGEDTKKSIGATGNLEEIGGPEREPKRYGEDTGRAKGDPWKVEGDLEFLPNPPRTKFPNPIITWRWMDAPSSRSGRTS